MKKIAFFLKKDAQILMQIFVQNAKRHKKQLVKLYKNLY